MGIVQKDAYRSTIVSYSGMAIGYFNKVFLFLLILTQEQIGLMNLLVSVGTLFGSLAALGSIHSVNKFSPFLKQKTSSSDGFFPLILLVCSIGIVIYSVLAWFFEANIASYYGKHSTQFVHYYYFIVPLGIANTLFLVFDSFLRSLMNNVISTVANELVLRLVVSALLIMLGMKWIDFDQFMVLHCLAYFVPVSILAFYLMKYGEFNLKFRSISLSKRLRKIIITFGLFSYLNTIGGMLVTALDSMMIAGILNLKETGIYTTIMFSVGALQIPYRSLMKISTPLVAKYWKERDMVRMEELYKKTSTVNLLLGSFMILVVLSCKNELLHFLPPDFNIAYSVFMILSVGWLVDMYFGLNGIIFIMSKKYKFDILFTLFMIVLVIVMNSILIPKFGIIGAAISTSSAFVLYNLFRFLLTKVVYKLNPFEGKQAAIFVLFVCLFMINHFFPWSLKNPILSGMVKASVIGLIYGVLSYKFRWVPELNKTLDKHVIRRFRK